MILDDDEDVGIIDPSLEPNSKKRPLEKS